MTEREALKLALEALIDLGADDYEGFGDVLDALEEALAQPAVTELHKQEPVAFEKTVCPFCTSEWVTAEQHDRNVDRVEQEPVGWLDSNDKLAEFMHKDLKAEHDKRDSSTPRAFQIPVYTTPPQRTWVGLTDKEAFQICVDCGCLSADWLTLLDAIEAKLKERNA